jgi:pimeloyl-ACP methyl ester carboxylesterase
VAERVVVVPGRLFGPFAPLLMYASLVFEARGGTIAPVSWAPTDDADGTWVRAQVLPAVDRHRATLIVGKSLGTNAATIAAERDLPGIWLTPLLLDDVVLGALRSATAPQLLIGGTADKLWDGAVARELSPHVLEVEGADHGMLMPGEPLARSAEVLGQVATAVEHFADHVL